jgi:hypothetical protein
MAKPRQPHPDVPLGSPRKPRRQRGDPARDAALAEAITELVARARKKYGALTTWWDAAGVARGTASNLINGKGRPRKETVQKLLAPMKGVLHPDPETWFEQKVQGRLAERSQFRPILLPTCVAPFSIDAITLRFGSHEANLTESDLTGPSNRPAVYVHGLFLQRTPGSLPSNLERAADRGVRHPTRHTPLTYLRYKRALTEQDSLRAKQPTAGLLALDKWGMELGPKMFGIIQPTRSLHPTQQSKFETSVAQGAPESTAKDDLRAAMTNAKVLYETTHAHSCLEDLIQKLGMHHSECKFIKVGSIGAAYQLAELNMLGPCLLAVGHELLWTLTERDESTLELLVSDEGALEKRLLPEEQPFRILAVRSDALSDHELDLTARWFQKMSANLRKVWEERFPQLCEFVKPELEKYGSLGGHYSDTHLKLLVAHGMHLHHPPLDETPKFVPLDKYSLPSRKLLGRPASTEAAPLDS